MTLHSRRTVITALAGAAAAPGTLFAQAAWPAKPIRLVVPFPPGGGTDLSARIIGERLAARLGQPVIIDNKPGASTAIGVSLVSVADPDGYTLLYSGSSSFTVNPAVRAKLSYDPFKQLSPIALVARAPLVLVTSANNPDRTLKQVLARAATKANSATYVTFGSGSAPHLAGEMLALAAGVKLMPVPYKGSAEAAIGVARGDVTLGVDTIAAANPHIQSGKLRALAVVSEKRTSLLPHVPSYGELQYAQAILDAWYAVAAPAGLQPAVRDTLVRTLTAVIAEPEVKKKLALQSMEAALLGPQQLRDVMDQEISRYRAVVARAGIRLD